MSTTAAPASRLNVVLMWHMHQPEYRDPFNGQFQRPWTYLHTIKDYVDMAAHIEAHPEARAVVNFVPVLLEQIENYAEALQAYLLDRHALLPDPLLMVLAADGAPQDEAERVELIESCLRANDQRLIKRFPAYADLAYMAREFLKHPLHLRYLGHAFFADLCVWYHLAWMAETVRRTDVRIIKLMNKGHGFDVHDRQMLLEVIAELMTGLLPRYRALALRGQVELSMTPYAHPIMPLLLDIPSAREAWPDVVLPQENGALAQYPGGEERVRWHLAEGRRVFERVFSISPVGCWPSEGSLSEATLPLLAEAGFGWVATGSQVLHNSLKQSGIYEQYKHCLHRFYCLDRVDPEKNNAHKGCPRLVFRDDGLSDLIGFKYSTWHADDAVGDLINHLLHIADTCHDGNYVASIIMDGENAWEYYPENGYYFLDALYKRLANHPRLNLTTYQELLKHEPVTTPLPKLVAGSWVYGTFSTWIGEKDKNRAWEYLIAAKQVCDRVLASRRLSSEQEHAVLLQLGICEGSDWFWWFGDYNSAEAVRDFERLFRLHLVRLYELLGEEPPAVLAAVMAVGAGNPESGGVMRTGQQN
ncbi:MAG: glycoside hydrolase family 57 protein [Halothiobacillaceae bacterium]|nr:glycoside hydrolase family 57 protein [Halothiobacillaceae bacterium]